MKALKIIFITLLTIHCKAQNPVIDIIGARMGQPDGYNIKDLNSLLNPFEGTYLYANGTTSFKIILVKKEHQYNGRYYEDLIIGEYQYIENGIERVNTLSQINTVYNDQRSFRSFTKSSWSTANPYNEQKGKVAIQLNPDQVISEEVSLLINAMDDHKFIAIINTTDNLYSSVTGSILQGEFQSSTLDVKTGIATAKQEVNVRVLDHADRVKGIPGKGMLHEVIEAYKGAKINQRDQIGVVPPALIGGTNPVYQEAHANSPEGQNADEIVYEKNPPEPGQIIYNPATEGCLQERR